MSQETINLLLGASISLVATILTIVVTSVFQFIRDLSSRKWQRKDHEYELSRQLIAHRIDELEAFTKEIVLTIASTNTELETILRVNSDEEIITYCTKINKYVIDSIGKKINHYFAIAAYFNNEELSKRFVKVSHAVADLLNINSEIVNTLKENKKLDIKEIETKLKKLDLVESYGLLLFTFDLIRSDPSELHKSLKTPKGDKSKRENKHIEDKIGFDNG